MSTVVNGIAAPTHTTWSAHRSNQRGSLRGHTSNNANVAAAARPSIVVLRNSEDGGLFHPCNRASPAAIEIASATARRRATLAAKPGGVPAFTSADMTSGYPLVSGGGWLRRHREEDARERERSAVHRMVQCESSAPLQSCSCSRSRPPSAKCPRKALIKEGSQTAAGRSSAMT